MKISSITCVALLTVASVDAAAQLWSAAQPTTQAQLIHDANKAVRRHEDEVCRGSGQVCGMKAKLKRIAEAAAQINSPNDPTSVSESLKSKRAAAAAPAILVTAQPTTPAQAIHDADKAVRPHGVEACRGSGQVCGIKAKLKRAASAAAEALAEPIVFAEPPHRFCYIPGGECSNAKREALALAEAAAEAYALAEPDANPCYLPGGECSNAKREALAAAESMAERDASAFPDSEAGKPPSPLDPLVFNLHLRKHTTDKWHHRGIRQQRFLQSSRRKLHET